VSIINILINGNDKSIYAMSKLLGLASKEDISKYEEEQRLITDTTETDTKVFI
jgi:hypothetical protein